MLRNTATFPLIGQQVFVITRNEQDLTCVKDAIVTGESDDHIECTVMIKGLPELKLRRPSQVFITNAEAQEELDYLSHYIEHRMAGHKTK